MLIDLGVVKLKFSQHEDVIVYTVVEQVDAIRGRYVLYADDVLEVISILYPSIEFDDNDRCMIFVRGTVGSKDKNGALLSANNEKVIRAINHLVENQEKIKDLLLGEFLK